MILRGEGKRRLIVGAFFGGMLSTFVIICLAGLGRIRPEPTLGIIGAIAGTITFVGASWRWVQRRH